MKEKEIRDRIQGFLKRTARTVVVPASVGLGLSAGACDRTSLNGRSSDAAGDSSSSDVAVVSPDTAGGVSDLRLDLPELVLPYLVVMRPDAGPDLPPIDVRDAQADAHSDARADLQPIDGIPETGPDAQPDIATPPPPYMVPPIPDAGRDLPAIMPPYMAPPPPPSPGDTAPVPPKSIK